MRYHDVVIAFTFCFWYNQNRAALMPRQQGTMIMAKDSNAVWVTINLDTLTSDQRKAYETYKVAQRAAAEMREAFETLMRDATQVPKGMKLAFGYRFGQLSTALVVDDSKPKGQPKAAVSLADYLKAQAAR